ncbi:hypothetical protein QJS83_11225 [Bdellovibrio sp. 22V]|uniref:DUF6790 family protein n=1 Tax=Bdellovibrio TaxID=958 RepID=UPI0025428698|nr:DUF6790 family protein [Bdellovibrio sp. 22V]WII71033.1 hypothetical protein QJS83_11225 [Bdellovibrio sp. 22V]
MEAIIRFVLSNFTLTFLLIGFLFGFLKSISRRKPKTRENTIEAFFSQYLFWAIGATFFYNFVMHTFFGDMSAAFIGWSPSPFQTEVGFASLGFSVVGFLAFKGSYGLRIGAVIGMSCFLLGAAAGHAYHMIANHNFAPGNAGIIFYTDILVPLIGFWFLYISRPKGK